MVSKKEIIELVVLCWGKGLTAKETVDYLKQARNIKICEKTVYRYRHSLMAKEIIDEIFREQRRDIALCQSDETRLKYRDKLLQKLLPYLIKA